MIYRLQKRLILICGATILSVVTLIFILISVFNVTSMNRNLDVLADSIAEGDGRFPDAFGGKHPPSENEGEKRHPEFITPETRFSTRHFSVLFDGENNPEKIYTDAIFSITEEDAIEYAQRSLDRAKSSGWISNYRYKIFEKDEGRMVVFVDGGIMRAALLQNATISASVLLGCAALIIVLILILSRRAVKPIAESYEKQKQFITNANHELKTPLTLILTNVAIAESELGKSEWLDDVKAEGERMTELINQMVSLSRMDEESVQLSTSELDLSEITEDTVADFFALALSRGKKLTAEIEKDITAKADETLIRRLLSILLDNAVKYCDDGGEITLSLGRKRHITLTVENTYALADSVELDRLFDRFYRADKSRTYSGSFGIGLSIAKAIVERHKGEITAYKKDSSTIGFKVTLKS